MSDAGGQKDKKRRQIHKINYNDLIEVVVLFCAFERLQYAFVCCDRFFIFTLKGGDSHDCLMLCTGEASRSLIIIACRFGILPYIPSFHRRSGASGRGLKGVEGHGSG